MIKYVWQEKTLAMSNVERDKPSQYIFSGHYLPIQVTFLCLVGSYLIL